jgi:endonuclease YncB( thermonuclease family)
MRHALLSMTAACALASFAMPAQAACPLTAIGTAAVAVMRDGRTLQLTDGRVLRLAAIEAPDKARAALQTLTAGRSLRLAQLTDAGEAHDRYGRLVAFAFAGDDTLTLQQRLLEQGAARVAAPVGNHNCANTLLAAERDARSGRRGLWSDPNFAPLAAENRARLEAERGHFALVVGKVLSVRVSGGTIYLNFGRHWTRDFSVLIPRRLHNAFAAAGVEPKGLAGRRVRVRGYIEERRGPVIEADAPEQIELAEENMTQSKERRP